MVVLGDLLLWALCCASSWTDRWMVLIAGFPTHHLRAPEVQYSRQRVYVFGDSLKVRDVCLLSPGQVRCPRRPPSPQVFEPLREHPPARKSSGLLGILSTDPDYQPSWTLTNNKGRVPKIEDVYQQTTWSRILRTPSATSS